MDYIKNISDVFMPKFDELSIKKLQRMIYKTNQLTKAKSLKSEKACSPVREPSVACGSAQLQHQTSLTFDFNAKLLMLKDFTDISTVLEKLHVKKT